MMEERRVFCIKCGSSNAAESRFCNECGATLPEQKETKSGSPSPEVLTTMQVKKTENTAMAPVQEVKKTEPVSKGASVKEPVAGWIVCTNGEGKGEDFRIRAGNNRIGNTAASEICLSENKAVNGDNCATIAYYTKQNAYYVMPGDSGDSLQINKEPVEIPTVIKAGDVITIGECEYKFIPLCTDDFRWE